MKLVRVVSQFVFVGTLFLGLGACAQRKSSTSQSPSPQANQNNILAGQEEAEVGEALLQSPSPQLSIKQFEKALQFDPQNPKANFYLSLVRPGQLLAELTIRSSTLGTRHDMRDLNRMVKGVNQFKDSSHNLSGLLRGNSLAGFQDFESLRLETRNKLLAELSTSIERMNRAAKSGSLVLSFKKTSITQSIDIRKDENQCSISGETIKCYTVSTGDMKRDHQMVVDAADFNVLSGSLKAIKNATRMSIAYQVSGLNELMEKVNSEQMRNHGVSAARMAEILSSISKSPDLGVLDPADELDQVAGSISDALVNAEYLATAEDLLCKNATRLETSYNLFNSICMSMSAVTLIHSLIEGPITVDLGVSKLDQSMVKIKMNVAKFLSRPIADLKDYYIANSKFKSDGTVSFLRDPSIMGLFPDEDFLEKVNALANKDIRGRASRLANDKADHEIGVR